ncbi:TonB-dependent receptor domain-containing protein [Hirschia litorea]|uniref:TonB-dependent receptor domain-containing protein n=1 Tax=Hirschia litorea TaxID=1199156 RepID=A0ABW2II70_9PROT
MKKIKPTYLGAVALVVGISPLANAQDRQDTIIVSSPGPVRTADELVGNATSMDRESIIDHLSGTLGDTLDRQPGVSSTFFGAGASRPVLRGLGAERVLVLTNGIGTIDVSATSPDHQVMADGLDAQRIEILRGPAALAYGGQAIGGIVNVIDGLIVETIPSDPATLDLYGAYNSQNDGEELSARTQFTAGNFVFTGIATTREFEDYDIPTFAESDAFRRLEEQEHHEEDEDDHDEEHDHEDEHDLHSEAIGTVENSFLDTSQLSAGVSWIGSNTFWGVGIRHQDSKYGIPGHSHEEHGEEDHDHEEEDHDDELHEDELHEEEMPFIDMEQTRYDFRGGIKFESNFLTELIATASYADYEHVEFEAPGIAGTSFSSEGFESRVELGHEWKGINGAWGLQVIDKELASKGEEAFITPTRQNAIGVFLYETKDWENGFGLEGGLRVDDIEYDNDIMGSAKFDLASGSLGLHQHWESGWFIGTQLSYTQRAPNESELFARGPHLATSQYEVGDASLEKETGLNFEGTVRWQNDIFEIGVSAFHTDFTDFIFLSPSTIVVEGETVSEVDELAVNGFMQEDATFSGGEIYTSLEVEDGILGANWSLNANVDYVDGQLDEGGNVPYLPPLTFNAGSHARWGGLKLGAELTIAAEQNNQGAAQLPTEGYTLVNLSSSYDLPVFNSDSKKAEIFLKVNNVGDEEIRYSTSVLKDVIPAPGRNIRVGFRLSM